MAAFHVVLLGCRLNHVDATARQLGLEWPILDITRHLMVRADWCVPIVSTGLVTTSGRNEEDLAPELSIRAGCDRH